MTVMVAIIVAVTSIIITPLLKCLKLTCYSMQTSLHCCVCCLQRRCIRQQNVKDAGKGRGPEEGGGGGGERHVCM